MPGAGGFARLGVRGRTADDVRTGHDSPDGYAGRSGDQRSGWRTGAAGSRVFAALGQLVTRHPWRVIGAWIIIAVAVIATAPKLPTTSNEASFLPSSYESIKAQNLQDQAFPQAGKVDATAAIIVFARSDHGR